MSSQYAREKRLGTGTPPIARTSSGGKRDCRFSREIAAGLSYDQSDKMRRLGSAIGQLEACNPRDRPSFSLSRRLRRCQRIARDMPGSNPAPQTRKRKWKVDHVVKIDLGDDIPDGEEITTVEVQQASRDGRRVERKVHSLPLPRDPLITVAPSGSPEDIDFRVDVINEDGEDCDQDDESLVAVSSSHLRPIRPELTPTVGRTVTDLDE